jgi:hypothetical protein
MALITRAPRTAAALAACALIVAGCSRAARLTPADAQRMIEAHPRFTAPQTLAVPARYCGVIPGAHDDPTRDVNRLQALQNQRIISTEHRPASADECRNAPADARQVFVVTLTDVGANFHPTVLPGGRGWQFVMAQRKFVAVHAIDYDNPDDPKVAHVDYVWNWVPTLLGQLLQVVNEVQLGASATFLRDGPGWIVRQPGM